MRHSGTYFLNKLPMSVSRKIFPPLWIKTMSWLIVLSVYHTPLLEMIVITLPSTIAENMIKSPSTSPLSSAFAPK